MTVNSIKSLVFKYPELLSEWNNIRNGSLGSYDVTDKSEKKVWWIGKCGHEWQATIRNRINGNGCPYCSIPAKRVLKGFNDLQTKCPDLAKEWHPTRNGDLTPDSVLCGSAKNMVAWQMRT